MHRNMSPAGVSGGTAWIDASPSPRTAPNEKPGI